MSDPLADLSRAGVSIWLDDLSRKRLVNGSLADLVAHDHVVGVTTNPDHLRQGDHGQRRVRGRRSATCAERGIAVGEALRAMTTFDVRRACDVLRPAYDATDGVDGRVSIEVDPRLAYDTEATIAEARVRCGGWSTGPTCSSRSRPRGRGCRPSRRAWPRASASTSR